MTEHASDYELDAIRLGTSEPEVRQHVEDCDECKARRDVLAGEAEAFFRRFDPVALAVDASRRAEETRTPWWRRWVWAGAAAMAAAGFLLIAVPPDGVRPKGEDAQLELFLRTEAGVVGVTGAVEADAHLAVRVRPPARRFVRLLWESEPHRWGALYPREGDAAWLVRRATWLEREVVLDGAPEPERLGAVLCEEEVDHGEAVALLMRESGEVRNGCRVEILPVLKR